MQLKSSAWGTKVVSDLADYLKRQNPKRREYAKRNLYNMVKFYEMYSREDFITLTDTLNVNEFVQLPTAQVANATIKQNIPSLLVITTFTNHVEIMNRCRTDGNIQPQPSMVVEKITMPEGDIVMVEVQPVVFLPVRYKGRVWVRVGPRKAVANDADEHILLERRAANVQTFDSTPCFGASINDLDLQVFKHISGCILVERKRVYQC